jgi:hypothetical protein
MLVMMKTSALRIHASKVIIGFIKNAILVLLNARDAKYLTRIKLPQTFYPRI